jgi:hypothetical protein
MRQESFKLPISRRWRPEEEQPIPHKTRKRGGTWKWIKLSLEVFFCMFTQCQTACKTVKLHTNSIL